MAKDFKTQLSGQIGEHLVVAELGRRGVIATPFAGNVPDIDVLAYANNKSVAVQVKAIRSGSVSVDAKKYLNIEFKGDVQIVKGKTKDINRKLIFVLVNIGEVSGQDRFFVYRQGTLQDLILKNHKGFLAKHNGIRPRNPKSTHCSYSADQMSDCEDNWEMITDELGILT
jgi:hypothetical protein